MIEYYKSLKDDLEDSEVFYAPTPEVIKNLESILEKWPNLPEFEDWASTHGTIHLYWENIPAEIEIGSNNFSAYCGDGLAYFHGPIGKVDIFFLALNFYSRNI